MKAYRFKIIKFTVYIINPLIYLAFAALFWIIAGRMQDKISINTILNKKN